MPASQPTLHDRAWRYEHRGAPLVIATACLAAAFLSAWTEAAF